MGYTAAEVGKSLARNIGGFGQALAQISYAQEARERQAKLDASMLATQEAQRQALELDTRLRDHEAKKKIYDTFRDRRSQGFEDVLIEAPNPGILTLDGRTVRTTPPKGTNFPIILPGEFRPEKSTQFQLQKALAGMYTGMGLTPQGANYQRSPVPAWRPTSMQEAIEFERARAAAVAEAQRADPEVLAAKERRSGLIKTLGPPMTEAQQLALDEFVSGKTKAQILREMREANVPEELIGEVDSYLDEFKIKGGL